LHIGITIGAALLISAIVSLISLESNKSNFFYPLNYVDQSIQNEKFIFVSDDIISYYDSKIKSEYSWDKFSGFVYKKGFLMLLVDKKVPTVFIVYQNEINDEQLKNFLSFLRTKMRQID